MSKSTGIVIAIMVIVAAVLINFMGDHQLPKSLEEFSSFFSGMLLAAGLFLLFKQISKKKI
jgi:hypothetical protein